MIRARGLTIAAAAAASGLAMAAALPVQAAAAPSWRVVFSQQYGVSTNYSAFETALATGPNNAWAFGGTSSIPGMPGTRPIAEHWNGKKWSASALPAKATDAIFAASAPAANNVWAATLLGQSVLHYNGSKWAIARTWKGTTMPLEITGITALAPADVWVFGGSGMGPGVGTWHLSGTTWTRLATGPGAGVFQASATSASDIWGLGSDFGPETSVVHFNGSAWTVQTAPVLSGITPRGILASSPKSVWVTDISAKPKLLHFNGTAWSATALPWAIQLWSIAPDGSGGLWFAGTSGTGPAISWAVRRTSAGAWSRIKIGQQSGNAISLVTGVPGTTGVLGVGTAPAKKGTKAAIWAYGKI